MAQQSAGSGNPVEDLQEAFYNFDSDRDYYLTLDELRYIITNDGEKMPANEIEEFLQEAANFANDGYVDYRSLAQMMVSEDD